MTDEKLTFDVTEGAATITLNRPDVLNALDTALLAVLDDLRTPGEGPKGVAIGPAGSATGSRPAG